MLTNLESLKSRGVAASQGALKAAAGPDAVPCAVTSERRNVWNAGLLGEVLRFNGFPGATEVTKRRTKEVPPRIYVPFCLLASDELQPQWGCPVDNNLFAYIYFLQHIDFFFLFVLANKVTQVLRYFKTNVICSRNAFTCGQPTDILDEYI